MSKAKTTFLTFLLNLAASPLFAQTPIILENSPKAVIDEVWQTVNREYVDPTFNHQDWLATREKLLATDYKDANEAYQAIRKTLKTLGDPYTRFLEPREFETLKSSTAGELVGVGILLNLIESAKAPTVISVLKNSPASRAGLQPRDELIAVDGKPTSGLDLGEISKLIRGPEGSKVLLSILRNNQKVDYPLVRSAIVLKVVTSELKDENGKKIGYIHLKEFSSRAPSEMREALINLSLQGAEGWVFDLRSNPGGVVIAATQIANLFLKNGTIVSTMDRNGLRETVMSDRHPLTALPLVLLIDGTSASASEILAAALQDNRRATLVGTRTFGKGVIQKVNGLTDGSGVNVTTARYRTPKGNDIHKKGVLPDILVDFTAEKRKSFRAEQRTTATDIQYQQAVAVLTEKLASTVRP
jgi:carboxyl-terminal processing protease